MKLELTVSDRQLAYVICSGYEGGINYWVSKIAIECGAEAERAARDHEKGNPKMSRIMVRYYSPVLDGYWIMSVQDDPKTYRLDSAAVARGIQTLIDKYPHHIGAVIGDDADHDAITGDVLIQCAIFGEIRYV